MYANAQSTPAGTSSTATATKISSAAFAATKQAVAIALPPTDTDPNAPNALNTPQKPDVRNLLLNLALRLIERAPESAPALADRFALHLDILQVRIVCIMFECKKGEELC